jgi:Bacterial mobilisation protein (MobC)
MSGDVAGAGGGRRQLRVAGQVRPHAHRVKVTDAQEAALQRLATAHGIGVARLLVECALAGGAEAARARASLVDELLMVSRALGRVGVNINQIARATNATGEVQPGAQPALAAVVRVCERLDAVVGAVALTGRRIPAPRSSG